MPKPALTLSKGILGLLALRDVSPVEIGVSFLGNGTQHQGECDVGALNLDFPGLGGAEQVGDRMLPESGNTISNLALPQIQQRTTGSVGVEKGSVLFHSKDGVGVLIRDFGQECDFFLRLITIGDVARDGD